MRFALKATFEESLFLAAYYEHLQEAKWTERLDDACDYGSLERVIRVVNRLDREVEIIPVAS